MEFSDLGTMLFLSIVLRIAIMPRRGAIFISEVAMHSLLLTALMVSVVKATGVTL